MYNLDKGATVREEPKPAGDSVFLAVPALLQWIQAQTCVNPFSEVLKDHCHGTKLL